MEVWEIVERVRKQKGISIAEVCGDEVSRSVYERFVKNTADTTITKFTYFLQRINLDYDELKIFNYPEETNAIHRMMKEMIVAFMSRDTAELQRIAEFCRTKERMLSKREEHLISLCEILAARLNNQEIDVRDSDVYQYLINAQTWTHYELVLFNNCMYAFTPEFVEMILERALISLSVYKDSRDGKSESFRMLSNAIVYFIQNNQRSFAWKYLERLDEFFLEEDMYFEKNLRLLLNGIWDTIRGNEQGKEKVRQALQVCEFLSSRQHYQMNYELLLYIEKMFKVDFALQ
ncbi:Rgg family transcriptional regulator [Enterococcus olivae]